MKWVVFILLFSQWLFAAEVIRVGSDSRLIGISHDLTRRWQKNDRVCVVQDGKEVVCGTVIKAKEKFCIVKLKEANNSIGRGDKVVSDTRPQKSTALISSPISSPLSLVESPPFHLVSMGGTLGPGVVYPYIHFQRIIDPRFAIGVLPSYLNIKSDTKSLSSIAVMITGNFYPDEFYKGLWIKGGLGLSFMSTNSGAIEQQASSIQALLTGGYRFKLDSGFNFGLGGGFQYLQDPEFSGLKLNGVGFKPIVLFDVGVNF